MDEEKRAQALNVEVLAYDTRPFGELQIKKAVEDLKEYADGKRSIDNKATENQMWWRLRHWDAISETNEGRKANVSVGSAWTVNSLLNKHADIMDSYPKPNILPREADDEGEAKMLTSIVPTILEQNDYEQVYRTMGWDFVIDGACITGVFWDKNKHEGMGDVAITNVDVHNLFWQPGVEDIQDSDKVYYVSIEDVDAVRIQYPLIADKIGPEQDGTVVEYIHDDNIDTSNCVPVVNMYYKKTIAQDIPTGVIDPQTGIQLSVQIPKTVVHLAIIVGDQLAFCSENEPGYEEGFYAHGKYPFVIRKCFPIKDSPWGFGYLDIMKNPQKDIDKLDQAIIKNALMKAKPRFWVKKNAEFNPDQFADWNNELVEVGAGDLGQSIKQIDVDTVPSAAQNHLVQKIEELKETSGNRDFSQGSTASGVTAASAIAALQEAGSKLSRDVNKELYRGSREEYYLIIELIRQFYDETRSFRVDDGMGGFTFAEYNNRGIKQDTPLPDGTVRHRRPMFDIEVTAEKSSPFSRAAQNETAKELYGLGLFAPENSQPALVCIDMMEFEGKDKVKQQIEQNSLFLQQLNAAMQLIQNQAMIDPAFGAMAMQQGLLDPSQMPAPQAPMGGSPAPSDGTPEERASRNPLDNSYAEKIRQRSANAANPQ